MARIAISGRSAFKLEDGDLRKMHASPPRKIAAANGRCTG